MLVAEIFDSCEFHDHKDTRLGRERSRVRLRKDRCTVTVIIAAKENEHLMNLVENIVCI